MWTSDSSFNWVARTWSQKKVLNNHWQRKNAYCSFYTIHHSMHCVKKKIYSLNALQTFILYNLANDLDSLYKFLQSWQSLRSLQPAACLLIASRFHDFDSLYNLYSLYNHYILCGLCSLQHNFYRFTISRSRQPSIVYTIFTFSAVFAASAVFATCNISSYRLTISRSRQPFNNLYKPLQPLQSLHSLRPLQPLHIISPHDFTISILFSNLYKILQSIFTIFTYSLSSHDFTISIFFNSFYNLHTLCDLCSLYNLYNLYSLCSLCSLCDLDSLQWSIQVLAVFLILLQLFTTFCLSFVIIIKTRNSALNY